MIELSKRIVLGTAGHIDHGKTSLVKALTGIDTDRLKEEKLRGITIELGFAHLTLDDGRRVGVVDVPGHERFVRTMVAGASGVDLVALVIAADEGVMPQTREHVDICELLGVPTGLVVLTKRDLVDQEWLDLVTEDVREYLSNTFLKDAPIVPVSSSTGQGLDQLRKTLTEICSRIAERRETGPFRLSVDRAFAMKGFGLVVTGTAVSGRIEVGSAVSVYPAELKAKVRGLQLHGTEVNLALSGQRTAVNLQGLEVQEVRRGDVVATPGSLSPSKRLDASLRLLKSAPRELKNRALVQLHLGTAEFSARVIPLAGETVKPGEEQPVQLLLEEPAAGLPGDHFVIRSFSPAFTLGGGRVLSVRPPRRKRFQAEELKALQVYQTGTVEDRVALLVKESRLLGLGRAELAAQTALSDRELDEVLGRLLAGRRLIRFDREAQKMVHAEALEPLTQAILRFLGEYHRQNPLRSGPPKEELKTRLRLRADPRLIGFQVARLVESGRLRSQEDWVALPEHRVSLASDLTALKEKILAAYRQGGLTPPWFKELSQSLDSGRARDVLDLILKEGELVKVKEDLFFDPAVVESLEEKVRAFLKERGEMTAQDFKDLTGVSRKFSIPLAEYLDRKGVTIRVGESRRLREKLT